MAATKAVLVCTVALRGAAWGLRVPGGEVGARARWRGVAVRARPPDWPSVAAEECEVPLEEASVASSTALVAGTTVGAGILALPQVTLPAGYGPGSAVLVVSWLLMAISGLLIAETTSSAICETRRPGLGLLATSTEALGPAVGGLAGLAYALIHYALLVAYVAQGGALLSEAASSVAGLSAPNGAALFSCTVGGALALGSPALVEALNSVLVVVVGLSFLALLALAAPEVDPARLAAAPDDWGAAFAAAPICVLAGVYHNVVPLLVTRFRGDRDKIRLVILAGSALPTVMFLLWNTLVCAAVDPTEAGPGFDPVAELRLHSPDAAGLGLVVSVFSFAAVASSFVGFYYGLRSYFCDLAGVADADLSPTLDAGLNAAILLPPLLVATLDPDVFLSALDLAGTFGITTLFLIIPAAIAAKQRAQLPQQLRYVPGGNALLALVALSAAAVVLEGAYDQLLTLIGTAGGAP